MSRLRKEIFNEDTFDTGLVRCIASKLDNKEYTDALKTALIYLTEQIRDISGLYNLDGDGLITKAFSPANPLIMVNELRTESDKSEQKGTMQILQGIYSAFRNPINHSMLNISENECLRKLIFIDTMLGYIHRPIQEQNLHQNILFDKISKDNIKYYLKRDIDRFSLNTLNYTNLWLYGESGIGKTNIAIHYALVNKRKFFHSIYFANINSIDEAFIYIYEELVDRLNNDGKKFNINEDENINRKIKKLFCYFSNEYETITIHFDEIYDFDEIEFHKLFIFLLDILKNNSTDCSYTNFNIFITSIINPLSHLETLSRDSDIEKIKEIFTFSELEPWMNNDITELFNLLNGYLNIDLQFNDIIFSSRHFSNSANSSLPKAQANSLSLSSVVVIFQIQQIQAFQKPKPILCL